MADTHHEADNQSPTFVLLIALRARVDWGRCAALCSHYDRKYPRILDSLHKSDRAEIHSAT
jgi:hypothetical protein